MLRMLWRLIGDGRIIITINKYKVFENVKSELNTIEKGQRLGESQRLRAQSLSIQKNLTILTYLNLPYDLMKKEVQQTVQQLLQLLVLHPKSSFKYLI